MKIGSKIIFAWAVILPSAFLIVSTSPALCAVDHLSGTWNSKIGQIKSVNFQQEGDQMVLHVWVGCGRRNTCDWGKAPIQPYTRSGRPPEDGVTGFIAELNLGSQGTKAMLVGHLNDDETLNITTFLLQSDQINQRDWWSNTTLSK